MNSKSWVRLKNEIIKTKAFKKLKMMIFERFMKIFCEKVQGKLQASALQQVAMPADRFVKKATLSLKLL